MRLLIVLPSQHEATGNFVTARRLQSGLQVLGMEGELFAITPDNANAFTATVERFRPDRLLLLHAWRSGRFWLENSAVNSCPTTVLLTGTDINEDVNDPVKGPVIEQVLQSATTIVSQNRQTVDSLRSHDHPWVDRLHYIPPGVDLGTTPYPLRKKHGIPDQCKLFLHPASIRPVKANLELLKLCDALAERNRNFTLAFCGPELDPDYFTTFITAIDQRPWAHYLGVIPTDAMPSAMTGADLILNHSISEGMSNALIEALAIGRQVLARNIPANSDLKAFSNNIMLYDSEQEFTDRALCFLSSAPFIRTLSDKNTSPFSAATEAEKFAPCSRPSEVIKQKLSQKHHFTNHQTSIPHRFQCF